MAQYYKPKYLDDDGKEAYRNDIFFHKGHVPPNIFTCHLPLLKRPPEDFIQKQIVHLNRRAAFMVCSITDAINRALTFWKRKACDASESNYEERFVLTKLRGCATGTEGVTCWRGAVIDDE